MLSCVSLKRRWGFKIIAIHPNVDIKSEVNCVLVRRMRFAMIKGHLVRFRHKVIYRIFGKSGRNFQKFLTFFSFRFFDVFCNECFWMFSVPFHECCQYKKTFGELEGSLFGFLALTVSEKICELKNISQ